MLFVSLVVVALGPPAEADVEQDAAPLIIADCEPTGA